MLFTVNCLDGFYKLTPLHYFAAGVFIVLMKFNISEFVNKMYKFVDKVGKRST